MASEAVNPPVNGVHIPQQSYAGSDHPALSHTQNSTPSVTNGAGGVQNPGSSGENAPAGAADSSGGVSKDEVGWYFVEQYYTTLSRNPEKLHLFHSKRSQFVWGVEAEKVAVSVGQRAINERIKELDIQDCKVRVSNVDSQESFKNIVVQVIGEISNKAAPHRKFVQTFVLAEQPNGYFVLNDIFRYIDEEDEEEDVENAAAPESEPPTAPEPKIETQPKAEPEPKTLPHSTDLADDKHVVDLIDRKLEETAAQVKDADSTTTASRTNGNIGAESDAEETSTSAVVEGTVSAETVKEKSQPAAVQETEAEVPRDPEPTPVASSPNFAKPSPVPFSNPSAPPKPAAPKTWAKLVAATGNRVSTPAVPNITPSNVPAVTQFKIHTPSAPAATNPAAPAGSATSSPPQSNSGAGWQTAGQDPVRRQVRQPSNPISGTNGEKTNVQAYVKNVTDKVDAPTLRTTLSQYGKLEYFDVSRLKNCAFVEFSDAAGCQAAMAANPHSIGGELIYVEERRPRPKTYGNNFNNRGNGMRGGRGGPDNRSQNQGRNGFQNDGGRSGYVPRGRGGATTPRGRGMPQAA